VGDLGGLESGLVGAEDRPSPGALPVGDLAGASPELDEDPRLPGRDRRRQSAASASSPAAAEGRGGSGAAGEGGRRPGRVLDAERDSGPVASGGDRPDR
ncbi:hypothetical protein C6P42_004731, partial [Pichia californica]